jgi:hypothetical protein
MDTSQSGPAISGVVVTISPVLPLAVAAYLARFKGQSRVHTESDLRGYLVWCEDRELDPFSDTASRRALPPVAARGTPIPALDGLAPDVGGRGVLPHLQGWQGRSRPATAGRQSSHRAVHRRAGRRRHPPDLPRQPDGPALRHSGMRLPPMHPHMLRHTFVTTMLDAGVDLRDVQIAARHADPRTTMRYDRARKNLDRHPSYILAAYMAFGTQPSLLVVPMWRSPGMTAALRSARATRSGLVRSAMCRCGRQMVWGVA